jgi:hypothetical protein
MRLFLDYYTRGFQPLLGIGAPLTLVNFKRRDNDRVEVVFGDGASQVALPAGTTGRLGLKKTGQFNAGFLAVANAWTVDGPAEAPVYVFTLNLNTAGIEAEFESNIASVDCMLEITWTTLDGIVSTSSTLPARIHNDVVSGDEGAPAELPLFFTSESSDFKATQAQAEAGADNAAWMSPLRTAQAIAALTPSGLQAAAPALPVPRVYFAPLPEGDGIEMLAADGTSAGLLPLANAPFVTAADLPAPLLAAYSVFLELLIYKPRRRAWKAPSPYILDENGQQVWQHPWPVNHPTRAGEHRVSPEPSISLPITISRPNHLPVTDPFQTLPAWQTLHGRIGPREVKYSTGPTTASVSFPVPIRSVSSGLGTVSDPRHRPWSNLLAPLHIAFRFVLWNPVTTRLHSGPMTPRIAVRPTKSPFHKEIEDDIPIATPTAWVNSPAYSCRMIH